MPFNVFCVSKTKNEINLFGPEEEKFVIWVQISVCDPSQLCHKCDPLIAVDQAIPINIRVEDHLVYLGVLHLLPQVGHDVAQLKGGDAPEQIQK